MVNVAQLVEHQIVALGVEGSNPSIHPTLRPIGYACLTPGIRILHTENISSGWRNVSRRSINIEDIDFIKAKAKTDRR